MTKEQRLEQHIETIARWIIEREHTVAFTGAGISTDSGIPDFRGPQGVWTRRDAGGFHRAGSSPMHPTYPSLSFSGSVSSSSSSRRTQITSIAGLASAPS